MRWRARTFYDFDDLVTAPLHGFASAEDYWARGSALPHLSRIGIPALLLVVAPVLDWPTLSWQAITSALTRPDDGHLLLTALTLIDTNPPVPPAPNFTVAASVSPALSSIDRVMSSSSAL